MQAQSKEQSIDSLLLVIERLPENQTKAEKLADFFDKHWSGGSGYFLTELTQNIEKYKNSGYHKELAIFYYTLGNINRTLSRTDKAQQAFIEGIKHAERAGHKGWQADMQLSLATLFCTIGDYKRSKPYLLRAENIAVTNKLNSHLNAVYQQYGVYYGMQNIYDTALKYQLLAIKTANKTTHLLDYCAQMINLGITYKKSKNYEKALEIFSQIQYYADSLNDNFLKMGLADNRGWTYLAMEKTAEAIEHGKLAVTYAEKQQQIDFQADAWDLLQRAYSKSGDYKLANDAAQKFKTLSDSIFNRSQIRLTKELNTKYEVELKDANLSKEKSKSERIKWISVLVAGFLICIVALIALYYRNAKRVNKKLSELNVEIENKNKELESLNNVKSILFTVISHDLRSPLNTLKLFMDRLSDGKVDEQKLPLYLKEISSDVNTTSNMIDNLLNWSQTQMQGYKTKMTGTNIFNLVVEELNKMQHQINSKNLQVFNAMSSNQTVTTDKELSSIIVRNILSNAIKFSKMDDSIFVDFDKDMNCLIIKDLGTGMGQEQLKLLNSNNLVHSTKGTNNEKGTGMGLMLCRNFAEMMGCELKIESEVNKGTRIELYFKK